MTADLRWLLELTTWCVFDVDDEGRVLAGYDGRGSMQLVEIAPDGRRTDLTDLPGACSGRYLRGQRAVVIQYDDGGNERAQLSLLSLATLPTAPATLDDLDPLAHDSAHIHHLVDVHEDAVVYTTNRRNDVDFDVVVRTLSSGDDQVVYDGGGYAIDVCVAERTRQAAVTLLSLQPNSTQVRIADPTGTVTDLTAADEHAWQTQVDWLAGGEAGLLISSNRDREYVAVAQVVDETWTWLVEDSAHDLQAWAAPDGTAMLIARNDDGGDRLALHDGDGAHLKDLDRGVHGALTGVVWAPGSRLAAVSFTAPTVPGNVAIIDVETGSVRTVADSRADVPADLRASLVEPSTHRVSTPDGEQIPCHVYTPGEPRGSAVLNIHGGPEGQAKQIFSPVVQALVADGHTVLVPNVRGSTGYGKRWYSLDDVRLRLDSVADLAALHAWLPGLGCDPARAALYGGSYGGYMVLAGLTMQPELWAAGVDIVGISSLVTFLENTSAYRRAVREREYGSLVRDRDFLEDASPITHLDGLRAPLFAIHGANDPRVPLTEAEQIKASLDAKGVPCSLLVYDDEGHGLAKRANRLDAYPQAIAFLAEHLANHR